MVKKRDFKEEFFYLENKAFELFKKGEYELSFEYYNKLLKASEDFKNNSWEKHFKWYDEVLSPCLKKYSNNYEEFFKHLFLVDTETYDAWFDKAELYEDNFKRTEAIEYYYKLFEFNPNDLLLLEYLGRLLCFSSRYDESLNIYDTALSIDNNNKKIIEGKWYVYYTSDRINDALNVLKNLDNIDDVSSWTYCATGYSFEENNDFEDAMWCYKKGFEIDEINDNLSESDSIDGIKRMLLKLSIEDYSFLNDFYLEWISKIEYKFDTEHCPNCGGKFTPIIYGLIAEDNLFDEQKKGNVILGGCTIGGDSPTHYCKNCDKEFQFKTNGIKINYKNNSRQYFYTEKIINKITYYIPNDQNESSINIKELENEMRESYGLNNVEFTALINKLMDIGYIYMPTKGQISLSEDNFYSQF